MVMGHAVDLQVFHSNDAVGIDDLTAFLMGEVVSPKAIRSCTRATALRCLRLSGVPFAS